MGENDNVQANHQEQLVALGHEKEVLKRFQIILRSGKALSVPYSMLPVFILTEESDLIVRAYGFLATLKGRNLKALDSYFHDERVLFVKESASGTDTGDLSIFISTIEITGRSVSEFLREDEI